MRVLLVYPNIWSDVFPLSILTLSAVLKEQGHDVRVFTAIHRRLVNMPGHHTAREGIEPGVEQRFVAELTSFDPQLVGFSVVEDAFPLAVHLLDALAGLPGALPPVIVGGVFATFAPARVLAHPCVNAVCVGEGEHPLRDVCDRLSSGQAITDVPGLWVKASDGSTLRNPRAIPVNLDALPTPDYSVLDRAVFAGPVPVIPHRGCPYPCTFCNSPAQSLLAGSGGGASYFRKQTMALLARDLHRLTTHYADKLNANGLYFCSDTLLAWTPYEFDAFIEMYGDFRIPFVCHTTPETISAERMEKLVGVGLKLVNIGVQHGNEQFRREVLKRRMPNQELLNRFAMAAASGAYISADFIMGFPLETPALARDTIAFSRELRASVKNCSVFVPYHGTALRQIAVDRGYLDAATLAVWSPQQSQLEMPDFPASEIARLVNEFKARPLPRAVQWEGAFTRGG